MTQKEQIAKALILEFDNANGKNDYFFEAYDLMNQETGFMSDLNEENNWQHIVWEIGNTQKQVKQFALRTELKIKREELDRVINQFLQ